MNLPLLFRQAVGLTVVLGSATAAPILLPADWIIGFDSDITTTSASNSPYNNAPVSAVDGNILTTYENTGASRSGLIITLPNGASALGSFTITSAGDRPQNDPFTWEIYGTNDVIISAPDSTGTAENWTLVSTGTVDVPETRRTVSPPATVGGTTAYASYRITFPGLRDSPSTATSLQFSEIQFYEATDGTGAPLLTPGTPVVGIHLPTFYTSSYPGGESPAKAIDGVSGSKYLNFAKFNTGIIITPTMGASNVQSFRLTTANDSEARDPANWILYGTNEAILSMDNGAGADENWTLIAEGNLALPAARNTLGDLIDVSQNTVLYTSYRLVFPRVKNPPATNSMQIAEIEFFSDVTGTTPIFSPADPIIAVAVAGSASASPTNGSNNESPAAALDNNTASKYLNFAKLETGFIVTPEGGSSTVRSFVITTANDAVARDPSSWALYGTNDPVISGNNSNGSAEAWTLIGEGSLALPPERQTPGAPVSFPNITAYTSYRLTFATVKDPFAANSMQIAEVQFYPDADAGGTPILTPASPILAVQLPHSASTSPVAENAPKSIDINTATKFFNGGGLNSGVIVTPGAGPSIITSFTLTTANDIPGRDPAGWSLFGTNSPVLSTNDSTGDKEPWSLIASGELTLPDERFTEGTPQIFANTTAYTSYKFQVTALKDAGVGATQFSEIQFDGAFAAVMEGIPLVAFTRAPGNGDFTLTWGSTPGEVFRIAWSTDMGDWDGTVADSISAAAGASTSRTFASPAPGAGKLFFRVERH